MDTFINNKPVTKKTLLYDGDTIQITKFPIIFRLETTDSKVRVQVVAASPDVSLTGILISYRIHL